VQRARDANERTATWNHSTRIRAKLASGAGKLFSGTDLLKLYAIQGGSQSLKTTLIKNALGQALNYAVSKGLNSLGIKIPHLNLLTSFVTGGIGGLVGDFTTTSFITSALQKLLLTGISALALKLDLPPPLTRLLTSVSSLLMGNLDNLPQAFQAIGITLAQELALSGLSALGDLIGLDPRITALINIPVRIGVGYAAGNVFGSGGTVIGYRDDGTPITVSNPKDLGDFINEAVNRSPASLSINVEGIEGVDIDGARAANDPNLWQRIVTLLGDAGAFLLDNALPIAVALIYGSKTLERKLRKYI